MIALGAGPGATRTYYIDAPLPWGDNTPIALPIDAITDDLWARMEPKLSAWADQGLHNAANEIGARVEEGVSKPLFQALDQGAVIVERVSWWALLAAAAIGGLTGYAIAKSR